MSNLSMFYPAGLDEINSNKNYIINGGFDVWQRGAYLNPTDEYGPDRWKISAIDTTDSQEGCAANRSYVTYRYPYGNYVWIRCDTALVYRMVAVQRIEAMNMRELSAGDEVTLSFWWGYEDIDNPTTLSVRFDHADSEDDFSTYTIDEQISVAESVSGIQSILQKYEATTTLTQDAIDNGLQVLFDFTSDGGSTVPLSSTQAIMRLSGVKLEKGSVATEFVNESHGTILSLCQRYYNRFSIVVGSDMANGTNQGQWRFPSMRITPSISVVSGEGTFNPMGTSGMRAITNATGFGGTAVEVDAEL